MTRRWRMTLEDAIRYYRVHILRDLYACTSSRLLHNSDLKELKAWIKEFDCDTIPHYNLQLGHQIQEAVEVILNS